MKQVNESIEKLPQREGMPPKVSTRAIASLVFGVLSLVCAGFLAGIPAIILGGLELKAIRAKQSSPEGEAIAKIGLILGIIGTALTLLAFILMIMLISLGISMSSFGILPGIKNIFI